MTKRDLASLGVRMMALLALLMSVQALVDVFLGRTLPTPRYGISVDG